MHHTAECRDTVLITPDTDVVASQAEALCATLREALDQGTTNIIMDLQEVEMVDALGLGVLIAAHNTLHEYGGSFIVVNVCADILRLLQLMCLDQHFAVTAREMACN